MHSKRKSKSQIDFIDSMNQDWSRHETLLDAAVEILEMIKKVMCVACNLLE